MAKTGKLTKLKSAIKRLPSFAKLVRTNSSILSETHHSSDDSNISSNQLRAVYVGKSRRQYLLTPDTIFHPLFQELIEKSSGIDDGVREVVVSCEVVLFEHLLWMIKSGFNQLGSMEELAEFYYTAC